MSNPFFQQQVPNIMQTVQQIRNNPAKYLAQKYNFPQGMNNPNDILNHLLTSGQVTQQQVNQAYQMAKTLGIH